MYECYWSEDYSILSIPLATIGEKSLNQCNMSGTRIIGNRVQAMLFSQYLPKPRTFDKGRSRCAEREICGETTFDDSSLPADL